MKKTFMLGVALVAACLLLSCSNSLRKTDLELENDKSLDKYLVTENYDYIYEVVNNYDKVIAVSTYLKDKSGNELLRSKDVTIASGSSYQFKYQLDPITNKYGLEVFMGFCCQPKGMNQSWGWEGSLQGYRKHRVTVVKDNNLWNGVNSWEWFGPELKTYESGYDYAEEIKNETKYPLNVQGYVRDYNEKAHTKEIIIPAGTSYTFKYKLSDINDFCTNDSVGQLQIGYFFSITEKNWYWGGMELSVVKNMIEEKKGQSRCLSVIDDGKGGFTFKE